MTDSLVDIKDMTVRIKGRTILDGVNLKVEPGSFHGIIGPNGAGKTTLFTTIQGFREPSRGTVRLMGQNPYPRDVGLLAKIGIQPQRSSFFPKTTLQEHLTVVAQLQGAPPTRVPQLIDELNLGHVKKTKVEALSGGERQRLAVATAIIHHPKILFLDEPTAGLDPETRNNLVSLLQSTNLRGMTTLYTTHFLDEAERLCDVVSILDTGRILTTESPRKMIENAALGSTVLLPHALHQADVLSAAFGENQVRITKDGVTIRTSDTSKLFVQLEHLGIDTSGAHVSDGRLEDVYLAITGKDYVA
ncbi:ABC transporter ATP-binding protein [Gleimia hominis]|uniref:ABC transporter ATP-binding protein n=1 Tax=Gleimia hominis TaxID=595468 RepID=A0ABU3I8Y6_9ACTO|nr:ABC transporter ATP-binding protein [Gleimia hominis]MDT3766826.1 ABC transporter ATP-binding protein [Gleimia hominis]